MDTATELVDVTAADRLKPFPAVAMKLMNECQVEVPDTARIIGLIECDPAIATKVLSVANSPLFGCTREINSIPRAVLVLGARQISSFVVSICVKDVFGQANSNPNKKSLLEHSLGAAIVAQVLASETNACDPSAAFLTGIVHDIGKLVFIGDCPAQYEQNRADLQIDSVLAEEEIFGVNHVSLGQRYLTNMGFPCEITKAVSNHHKPDSQDESLCQIASCANQLAKQWELGTDSHDQSIRDLAEFNKYETQARECFESSRCVFLS